MSVLVDDTIKGSFHQGDSRYFSIDSIGRQCMANAVAGAVYATMLPVHFWTAATLDRILIAGDHLYLQRCDSHHRYLQMSDIQNNETLFNDEYVLNRSNPMTGLVESNSNPSPPFFTLQQAILTMENRQAWTYGVLTIADEWNGASVLICVKEGNYYIFDTHSRDRYGNVVSNGTSVLLHFRNRNGLIRYIRNVAHQLCASQFEIVPLSPITVATHRMLQSTRPRANSYKSSQTQQYSQSQQDSQVDTRIQDENLESKRKRVDSDKSDEAKEMKAESSRYKKQEKKKTKIDDQDIKCPRIRRSQFDKERVRKDKLNIERKQEKDKEKSRLKEKENLKKLTVNTTNEDGKVSRRYNTHSQSSLQPTPCNTSQEANITTRRNTHSQSSSQATVCNTSREGNISTRRNTHSQISSKATVCNTSQQENISTRRNTSSQSSSQPTVCNKSQEGNITTRRNTHSKSSSLPTVRNTTEEENMTTRRNTRSQSSSQPKVHNTSQEINMTTRRNTRSQSSSQLNTIQSVEEQNEPRANISTQDSNYVEHAASNINHMADMDECLRLFNIQIYNGPVYICTVCLQTWFRRSVSDTSKLQITSPEEHSKLDECRRNYISVDNKEWICRTCRDSIKEGKIPKLSIQNKMGFPQKPKELDLNGMEEHFTAPRLTLFQMRDLACGGQKSVKGNSVNLPIDIAPTVDMLPRTLDNTETIAINFER